MIERSRARGIIIQARMSSNRFPGKMLATLAGHPLIEYVYQRCKASGAGMVLVATSDHYSDDSLYAYCRDRNIKVIRGDLDNVLKRYICAAESEKISYICRVCGDTPFVDTALINSLFHILENNALDYVAPDRQTCASGFYSETFTLKALKRTLKMAKSVDDLEHVTKYILDNKEIFKAVLVDAGLNPGFATNVRLTIDFPEDMEIAQKIATGLPRGYFFSSSDVINLVKAIKR